MANYGARLAQRSIKRVSRASHNAQWQVRRELGAMQCARRGHIIGQVKEVGAYRRKVGVCQRCWKVIEVDPGQREDSDGK